MSLQNILNSLDKVIKTGHNSYKALCPCHAENTPSMTIKEDGNNIICHCFGCGANGMEVVQALGLESSELFNESRRMNGKTEKSTEEIEREQNKQFLDDVSSSTVAANEQSPVAKYLQSRGIRSVPKTVRLLPEYRQNGKLHPCMIARIDDNERNRISYHLTHLTYDGKKADVEIIKKILPCERESTGGSIKLFPHSGTLAVAEGIETALIFNQVNDIPCWALVSAQNMKTWRVPGDVVDLIIVADIDASFTGQSVAYELARRSVALIGKDGYKLKRVNVRLLFKFRGETEEITDCGIKIDYADFGVTQ